MPVTVWQIGPAAALPCPCVGDGGLGFWLLTALAMVVLPAALIVAGALVSRHRTRREDVTRVEAEQEQAGSGSAARGTG